MPVRPALVKGSVLRGCAQGDSHINHSCQFLPKTSYVSAASSTMRVLPIVKDGKAVAQEIGPANRAELGAGLGDSTPLLQDPSSPTGSLESFLCQGCGCLRTEQLLSPVPGAPHEVFLEAGSGRTLDNLQISAPSLTA